jgi:hypothetical protein
MARLRIDRLSLTLPEFTAGDAERLARLIAAKLASATLPDLASRQLDSLVVTIADTAPSDQDKLADQIVGEILWQLGQALR